MPRVIFHYAGEQKARALATVIVMTVKNSLSEHGGARKYYREVKQEELALSSGLSRRETMTRRISAIASEDFHTKQPRPGALLHRKRRGRQPDLYKVALPDGKCFNGCLDQATCTHKPRGDRFYFPSLDQLLADPEHMKFWKRIDDLGASGYKDIPYWLYDRRLPLNDNDRLVMVFYIFLGLLDPLNKTEEQNKREGKLYRMKGVVFPKLKTTAAACGLCVETVRRCNEHLAALGLIRVAPEFRKGNVAAGEPALIRLPNRIVYLPSVILSEEEALNERIRMMEAANAALREQYGLWIEKALNIHRDVLNAWKGKEHRLEAFWREIRRLYGEIGMAKHLADSLIPAPPG